MRRIAMLALALAAGSAQAGKVYVDHDRLFDFKRCRTFAWDQEGTPAKSELMQRRIEAAVLRELQARGLTEAATPDLTVATHTETVKTAQPAAHVGIGVGGWGGGGGISVGGSRPVGSTVVQNNSLVIQIYDAAGGNLVWEARASEVGEDPEKIQREIDRVVEKAFKKYPVPPKK